MLHPQHLTAPYTATLTTDTPYNSLDTLVPRAHARRTVSAGKAFAQARTSRAHRIARIAHIVHSHRTAQARTSHARIAHSHRTTQARTSHRSHRSPTSHHPLTSLDTHRPSSVLHVQQSGIVVALSRRTNCVWVQWIDGDTGQYNVGRFGRCPLLTVAPRPIAGIAGAAKEEEGRGGGYAVDSEVGTSHTKGKGTLRAAGAVSWATTSTATAGTTATDTTAADTTTADTTGVTTGVAAGVAGDGAGGCAAVVRVQAGPGWSGLFLRLPHTGVRTRPLRPLRDAKGKRQGKRQGEGRGTGQSTSEEGAGRGGGRGEGRGGGGGGANEREVDRGLALYKNPESGFYLYSDRFGRRGLEAEPTHIGCGSHRKWRVGVDPRERVDGCLSRVGSVIDSADRPEDIAGQWYSPFMDR